MSTMRDDTRSPAWVPTTAVFGARLALIRQHEGWNIKEAALACRIPEASWRSWENGARPREYDSVCRLIAERTACDFYWLLAGDTGPGGSSFHGAESGKVLPRPDSNREPAGYRTDYAELQTSNLQAA